MLSRDEQNEVARRPSGRIPAFAWGLAAGIAAAAGLLIGRKAVTQANVGQGHSIKHRALDMAASIMQPKYPIEAITTFLNGFHFYADDMGRQIEAHHFCIHLQHDLHQCIIFDSNRPGARLIGVEYIVSEERFRELPEDEKQLWHSHHYEVKSGELIAPGIPEAAELAYFKDLVSTYGKTFHTWQIDRDDFPYGIPQLMMGFTQDGQLDERLVEARDRRLGVSSKRRRQNRSAIPMPIPIIGANSWESGTSVQTQLRQVPLKRPSTAEAGKR